MFNRPKDKTRKGLLSDEKAVSPMIATIMLIAIVAVLGAVIAASSMKSAGNIDTQGVTATLTAAQAVPGTSTITLTHDGGDKLVTQQLSFSVTSGTNNATFFIPVATNLTSAPYVSAGDVNTITKDTSGGNLTAGTYHVVIKYENKKVLLDTNVEIS